MNKKHLFYLILISGLLFHACKKQDNEPDMTYPEINQTAAGFPQQCSQLKRGETFTFRAFLSDNVALGSLSIDVHHNFDQHSHSTEVQECQMDSKKAAVNPFLLIKSFSLPTGLRVHEFTAPIEIPADIDPGDYHFLIRLTDKAGWQTIKGYSVKILP